MGVQDAVDDAAEMSAGPNIRHFLSSEGDFDTTYFGSTAAEAVLMDPQHRLLLQQTNSACTVGRTPDSHFGVYVGISQFEYAIDVQQHGHFVAGAYTRPLFSST
jgi:acyl transferase domain-containing protein